MENRKISLYEAFGEVKDTRDSSGLRHLLQPFLAMTTSSIMSGWYGYRELATFFDGNRNEFEVMFNLKHGVPKYTQTRTILQGIDYPSLYTAFHKWATQYIPLELEEWISGDGKGLNSTVTDCHNAKQNYVAMVSLFAQKTGTAFAVSRYENGKKGEGAALRELVEKLEIQGVTITLDALHCQKKQLTQL